MSDKMIRSNQILKLVDSFTNYNKDIESEKILKTLRTSSRKNTNLINRKYMWRTITAYIELEMEHRNNSNPDKKVTPNDIIYREGHKYSKADILTMLNQPTIKDKLNTLFKKKTTLYKDRIVPKVVVPYLEEADRLQELMNQSKDEGIINTSQRIKDMTTDELQNQMLAIAKELNSRYTR